MAQLLVRNLETAVKVRLQRRAELHGRSMEEEARDILRDALKDEATMAGGLGTEIATLFHDIGLEEDLARLPASEFRAAKFES